MSHKLPLSQQMKALEHLQELDLKIDQLNRNKNGLPLTLKTLKDDLGKAQASVQAQKDVLAEMEKAQRQTKAALELGNDRLARSNSRYEAVQNSQEYQAISKEIDQLKKMNTSLEEQAKKSQQEMDVVSGEISKLGETVAKFQGELDGQMSLLSAEGGKLENEVAVLVQERAQYTSQVEARTLALYDRVRGARNGLGISPAAGGRCKGCNMVVAPQLYNEICRGNTMHTCPTCHRILYVPVSSGATQA